MNTTPFIETISFIGSGNVASHLALALQSSGKHVLEVFSPNGVHSEAFAQKFKCKKLNALSGLNTSVDLCIIAVPDDSIAKLGASMPAINGIVVHTSGITSMDDLATHARRGVFYPLQTFSLDRELDMSKSPFCIEAIQEKDELQLIELANLLSKSVYKISSEQRKYLHLTAVMVSNFSNHLYHLAHDILETKALDFDLLLPLIIETASKVHEITPGEAQTGPARRKDHETMRKHLEMLADFPEYAELYRLLSGQILRRH